VSAGAFAERFAAVVVPRRTICSGGGGGARPCIRAGNGIPRHCRMSARIESRGASSLLEPLQPCRALDWPRLCRASPISGRRWRSGFVGGRGLPSVTSLHAEVCLEK